MCKHTPIHIHMRADAHTHRHSAITQSIGKILCANTLARCEKISAKICWRENSFWAELFNQSNRLLTSPLRRFYWENTCNFDSIRAEQLLRVSASVCCLFVCPSSLASVGKYLPELPASLRSASSFLVSFAASEKHH